MNQALIAFLTIAGFVLAVDWVTTRLRKRARSKSVTLEPPPTEEELGGEPNEGVAIEYE
jgi:hypothetical protein